MNIIYIIIIAYSSLSFGFAEFKREDIGPLEDYNRFLSPYKYVIDPYVKELVFKSDDGRNTLHLSMEKKYLRLNGKTICDFSKGMKVAIGSDVIQENKFVRRHFICIYPPVFILGAHGSSHINLNLGIEHFGKDSFSSKLLSGDRVVAKVPDSVLKQYPPKPINKDSLAERNKSRDCVKRISNLQVVKINKIIKCINEMNLNCLLKYFNGKKINSSIEGIELGDHEYHGSDFIFNESKKIGEKLKLTLSNEDKNKVIKSFVYCSEILRRRGSSDCGYKVGKDERIEFSGKDTYKDFNHYHLSYYKADYKKIFGVKKFYLNFGEYYTKYLKSTYSSFSICEIKNENITLKAYSTEHEVSNLFSLTVFKNGKISLDYEDQLSSSYSK